MPCDTKIPVGMTSEQRRKQVQDAIARLEQQLKAGSVTVRIGPGGALAFVGWDKDRDGVSDVCAARSLLKSRSWELRKAIAAAEAGGAKFQLNALASGMHSHDGGQTWHPGH